MAVYFIVGRLEKGFLIFSGGVDMFGFHDPDADAFISAAIHIAGVFERHLRIRGVQAASVFVAKSLFRADKYFPKWPVFHNKYIFGKVREDHTIKYQILGKI